MKSELYKTALFSLFIATSFSVFYLLPLTGMPPLAAQELAPYSAAGETVRPTRVEVDEGAAVIRFFVNGIEQARLTQHGLAVRESIEYGGTMTDTRKGGFDSPASGEVSDAD